MAHTGTHHRSIRSPNLTHVKFPDSKPETRRGVELYKTNPFIGHIATRVRKVINNRGDMMLIKSSGETVSPVAGFWEVEEVDSAKFVKLFVNGVKALAGLTNAGTRVFELLYIQMQNNIGKDQIYLSYSGLEDDKLSEISRSTFSRGLNELIQKEFIAAMPAVGWYWVNPDFIWNGDRLAFVKEYRKKGRRIEKEKDVLTADMFDFAEKAKNVE